MQLDDFLPAHVRGVRLVSPSDLILVAPLDGWSAPLREVPDPVFAGQMMGDGLAIDPLGSVLCAPCDGEVTLLHAAGHAITLRAANGAEILMHLGLDTVALGGRGFSPHVQQGARVKVGDALISFDLDQLARAARSLITPIVVANGDGFEIVERAQDCAVTRGQKLMTVRKRAARPAARASSQKESRRAVRVPLAHGLHARPAAKLAELAKSFAAEMGIEFGGRHANARCPVAVMGLGLARDAAADLVARGADADEAVAALAALIESGMGESFASDEPPPARAGAPVRAAPGIVLGVAVWWKPAEIFVTEKGQGAAIEARRLEEARAKVREKLSAATGGTEAAILAAHRAFLDDPELTEAAAKKIAEGKSAGFAWRAAIQSHITILRGVKDARLAERAADLADLERQILTALGGAPAVSAPVLPENAILLADDLLPSQLLALDIKRLAGFATAQGGPTSHVAILAAGMGIPALVACGAALSDIKNGARLLLDAGQGKLIVDPPDAQQEEARQRINERRSQRAAMEQRRHHPARTRDGVHIEVNANLASLEDARASVIAGAEGCGLLRTEFLFLDRAAPPGEDEQAAAYRAIAEALEGRPLTIRTMDIGGDKPASYLSFPREENPALGLRGVRVSLWRPDLLKTQLRAILRGVPNAQCRIMVPMVASVSELRQVRQMLDAARAELGIVEPALLGVMVETPAAAVTADILAAEADFMSIGTNDLTQYGLAMDRGNANLAADCDALHPAVLRLIAATCEGAAKHNYPVAVCGGLASDPLAAPVLIGLGVRGLSATIGAVAELKMIIGNLDLEQCRALARQALAASSAAEVRQLLMGEK